ncbi:hypothetical protein ACXHXG_04120 [Rhizobium sp. LEGMi198b]|uniref:hypothetical protein n=1 Tax=unclassified Rhizobium TaxID=2613769 RepID=UPI000CDF4CF5|nr:MULTISPECIES: hypothetical protein [Rhizobium]AVA20337.1 hypothetical protein NXC24_CH00666 [Rhizobium sp. NXC24]MDK4740542.1 hypothetical protein [Rhizobium sp. CNPSo 3464]UWU21628.1 hypothetical protein N2601_01195 [Rhizobium tropici]
MSPTLSRYLKDFSAEPPPPPSAGIPDMPFEETLDFPETPVVVPIDIEAERREAYAEGHEAATQELTQKHQAELETIAETHRGEMDALRARYEERAAEKIVNGLKKVATMLGQAISAEAAVALAPIMTEALTARAVADLAERVTAAILDGAAGPITVSGPRHLFEALHASIGQNGVLLRHVEARDVDLTVTIGESVLVTRMSAWAASLKEILK